MNEQTQYYEIDLRDIFKILRKHIAIIIALPMIAALVAGAVVFYVIEPTYEAVTTLLVSEAPTEAQIVYQDILANRQLVKTYREIARSRSVLEKVIYRLDLESTPEQLRGTIDVTLKGETEIIQVSVQHKDPSMAQLIAEHTASVFMTRVQDLMRVDNVTVVDTAAIPTIPVKPRKMLTVVIAGFLGLMVSLGLAFLLEYMDNTIKTPEDVEAVTGLPLLGAIPRYER